jgi:hypothetical protein
MMATLHKGKERALDAVDSDSDSESYSKEYLDGLLEKARNAAISSQEADQTHENEEEIMFIDKQDRDT